jgi:hypothetical protein
VPPSHDDSSSAAAPPMSALSPVNAIPTIPPADNAAPKRKASQKPGYVDYDEEKLQDTLNAMEDAVIWGEKHQELYKTMVRSDKFSFH